MDEKNTALPANKVISATASGANILPMSQQAKALYISMFILLGQRLKSNSQPHGHIEVMREIF